MRHLRNVKGFFSDYYLGSVFAKARRRFSDREIDYAFRRYLKIRSVSGKENCREKFIRPFLRDVLGFHLGSGEDHIHIVQSSAAEPVPLMAAYCGEWSESLDHRNSTRLEKVLANRSIPYGVLVTGERYRLIRAPGEGPHGAYLEIDLESLAEDEDLDAFALIYRLLHESNFVGDPPPIREIEAESRKHAEGVSEDLKRAVFDAAERLVKGLIGDRTGLSQKDLSTIRDAALTALYRMLFILYAESRDPRLQDHPVYHESYSIQGLVDELFNGGRRAENRSGLWDRFRALFRIYDDQGLPQISEWEHIPPRGGEFFKASTPEGRILDQARLTDMTVADVVLALTTTVPRVGVGRERVSFRELGIENLGAVYEGLLEYEPRIAQGPMLEIQLSGKKRYVLSPEEVVRLCKEEKLGLKGDLSIAAGSAAESLVSEGAAEEPIEEEEGDEPKRGGHAALVRRLEPGSFYFVPGAARKGSGSFYTPLPLVQDIIRHTLGPMAEGKSAAEIESLRVLDPACGSAHFLVEAMRFLGQALHKAYVEEHKGKPPPGFRATTGQKWDADWKASDEQARAANSEARAWCKRRIAERCLFGVDLNPTAVGLARVALWIESLAGDRPLTYFEHHIRWGNSLLGTWRERLHHQPLGKSKPGEQDLFADIALKSLNEAAAIRKLIDHAGEAVEPESIKELQFKERQKKKADEVLAGARLLFDLRSASPFAAKIWQDWRTMCGLVSEPKKLDEFARSKEWSEEFEKVRDRERYFHWEVEFPEVFLDPASPGFDVILGNPPWDKIKPDKKEFYGQYDVLIRAFVGSDLDSRIAELHREHDGLKKRFAQYQEWVKLTAACLKSGGDYEHHDCEVDGKSTGGDPDVFKFFVERGWRLAREGGRVGFVVPSAIYNNEGCTGLRRLLLDKVEVERFYGFENRKKIFPIDSRYKFVSLVFRKGASSGTGFEAAFMRHDLEELSQSSRAPWVVSIRKSELERLSPGTLAFLEYRSPRDREIVLKMYGYDRGGSPVNPRPLLGDKGSGTWNARFYREFDMTNDKDLWTDPVTSKLYNPRQILGAVSCTASSAPFYNPAAWPEVRERMAAKGFWPLYEGKHIDQFLVDTKPIERWVSLVACEKKFGKPPDPGPKVVFRDIARNTDERTCIAAVLPKGACANNKLPIIKAEGVAPDTVVTVLNSFAFDYLLRFRVSSTVNFTHISRVAVPAQDALAKLKSIRTESLSDTDSFDNERGYQTVTEANLAGAQSYGLDSKDFAEILATFPVFARKRPEFYTFLLNRLKEE